MKYINQSLPQPYVSLINDYSLVLLQKFYIFGECAYLLACWELGEKSDDVSCLYAKYDATASLSSPSPPVSLGYSEVYIWKVDRPAGKQQEGKRGGGEIWLQAHLKLINLHVLTPLNRARLTVASFSLFLVFIFHILTRTLYQSSHLILVCKMSNFSFKVI